MVHSSIDVKSWVEQTPDVETARPAHCPGCGAAGRPVGEPLGLVGHGLRGRQLRGPLTADQQPAVHTIQARRYRCRRCRATITVLPRGAVRARHFSASAIALACVMYGLSGASLRATRARIAPWRSAEAGWPALGRWLDAIARRALFAAVRPWPRGWPRRRQAERVATSVLAMTAAGESREVRAYRGAELLACA